MSKKSFKGIPCERRYLTMKSVFYFKVEKKQKQGVKGKKNYKEKKKSFVILM